MLPYLDKYVGDHFFGRFLALRRSWQNGRDRNIKK